MSVLKVEFKCSESSGVEAFINTGKLAQRRSTKQFLNSGKQNSQVPNDTESLSVNDSPLSKVETNSRMSR